MKNIEEDYSANSNICIISFQGTRELYILVGQILEQYIDIAEKYHFFPIFGSASYVPSLLSLTVDSTVANVQYNICQP